MAKIIGGVAVINIGAASETAMKEKKARMEDALNATRAAVEEGVVPGGGVALVRCVNALEDIKATGEEKSGIAILKRALTEPLKQIAENAGHEGSVVLNKVLEGKDDFGFNAQTEVYENLLAAGVIDPTKVVRYAIQNAASVSGLMLTTEAMIAEKPEKKKEPAMPPGGMPGGMSEMEFYPGSAVVIRAINDGSYQERLENMETMRQTAIADVLSQPAFH